MDHVPPTTTYTLIPNTYTHTNINIYALRSKKKRELKQIKKNKTH